MMSTHSLAAWRVCRRCACTRCECLSQRRNQQEIALLRRGAQVTRQQAPPLLCIATVRTASVRREMSEVAVSSPLWSLLRCLSRSVAQRLISRLTCRQLQVSSRTRPLNSCIGTAPTRVLLTPQHELTSLSPLCSSSSSPSTQLWSRAAHPPPRILHRPHALLASLTMFM
jgi:hypothetical protein